MNFLETQLMITQNVYKHLEMGLQDLEQYTRRPCPVVNGMMEPR